MSNASLQFMLRGIKADISKNYYKRAVERFGKFTGIELDDMVDQNHKELEKLVFDYIIHLETKDKISPNTIPTLLAPIKSFCVMNDILLNWKKIGKLLPAKVKLTGQSAWQTEDVQKMLDVSTKLEQRALIHVLASTATRIGGFEGFQLMNMRDVDHGCKKLTIYAGDIEEYITFLTPEASYAVDLHIKQRRDQGEEITPESYLFRAKYPLGTVKLLSRGSMSMIMQRIIIKANLRGNKKLEGHDRTVCNTRTDITYDTNRGARYGTQLNHGFRKRYNTIMKLNNQVNDNAIEKMMGHKNGLDGTYLQITDERLLAEFMKGVVDLTVSDEQRLKRENIELETAKLELETKLEEKVRLQDEKIERFERKYKYLDAQEECKNE